jgi:hypothetical protein
MKRPALPEPDQAGRWVLHSLASIQSRRSNRRAMDEFIDCCCPEPRLALDGGVVHRYRMQMETKQLAASAIDVPPAAHRLACASGDTGLPSPELVAGIGRVKGVPRLSRRLGNWLTAAEGHRLLSGCDCATLRGEPDAATLPKTTAPRGALASPRMWFATLPARNWTRSNSSSRRHRFRPPNAASDASSAAGSRYPGTKHPQPCPASSQVRRHSG